MVAPKLKAQSRSFSEVPRFLEVEAKQAAERAMKVYADTIKQYNSKAEMAVTDKEVTGAKGPRKAFVEAATESNKAFEVESDKLQKKLEKEFPFIGTS